MIESNEYNNNNINDKIYYIHIFKIKTADLFTSDENYAVMFIFMGTSLFSSFFDINGIPGYYASEMPGEIEGIHGSCLTGYNIGVAKHIPEENIKASVEVVKYFTSKYVQKNFFVKAFNVFTAMKSLYDDEEVCEVLDCKLAKNIQSIPRPSLLVDDYDAYSSKIVDFIYEFLFYKRPFKDILLDIDNLTRIHFFTIHSDIGLIAFILLIITFYSVLLSTIMLFIPSLKKQFRFLSKDSWIIYIIGFLILISSETVQFGELTEAKCNLRNVLFILGFSFIYIPIFHRLIINFPFSNKFTKWAKNNRLIFNGALIGFEILYNLLYLTNPYQLQNIIHEDENNHSMCKFRNGTYILIGVFQIIIHFLLYFSIISLIFLEWNIMETFRDIRYLTIMISISTPSILLLFVLNFVEMSNFKLMNLLHIIVTVVYVISNHFYMFFVKIIISKVMGKDNDINAMSQKLFHNSNSKPTIIQSNNRSSTVLTNASEIKSTATYQSKTTTSTSTNRKSTVLSCHFATSISEGN